MDFSFIKNSFKFSKEISFCLLSNKLKSILNFFSKNSSKLKKLYLILLEIFEYIKKQFKIFV